MNSFELGEFFLLREPSPNPCVADMDEEHPYETEKINCPVFPGHKRPGRRLSALRMVIPCVSPPDFIFTWMSAVLVQERVEHILAKEGLTGFTTNPASAKLKNGRWVGVREFVVTGWGGMAPQSSGIREVERCGGCGLLRYSGIEEPRRLIDKKNWDGSDFFVVWPLPRYCFVTHRVVDACRRLGITGVEFEQNFPSPTDKVISGYSPGRLSYYMPKDRAHLLGDELGIY